MDKITLLDNFDKQELQNQIDAIKEQDSVQPDWNQNDETQPDYIKNRTHYVADAIHPDIEWDGNPEGKTYFIVEQDSDYTVYYAKVSDKISTREEMLETEVIVKAGEEIYSVILSEEIPWEEMPGAILLDYGMLIINNVQEFKNTIAQDGIILPPDLSEGLYLCGEKDGTELLFYTSNINFPQDIQEIDKKYLPESNIKNSTGAYSLQQTRDSKYTGVAIKTKNPNAYALDNTLTDNEPIGATGEFASSFGGVTSAQGKRSFACGTNTIAKGKYSFASGDNAVALGNESFVSGCNTVTLGQGAFATGIETQAIGNGSVATGSNTQAISDGSSAIGIKTKASGSASHSQGYHTIAEGAYSHAEGADTIAKGHNSHAEGADTIAEGDDSHAEGVGSYAKGAHSHAQGNNTQALLDNSSAAGNCTIAGYANQFIVGRFNRNTPYTIFEVGNGANDSKRSNAFEVYDDGHAEISVMGSTEKSVTTKKYVDDKIAEIPSGGGVTVDQTYNAESENAQSGKAVAEAINEIDDKKVNKILRSDVTDILEYDHTPDRVPYMYGVYGNEDYEEQQGLIKGSMGKLCKEMAAQIEKDDKKGARSILSGVIPSKYRGMLDPYTVAIRDGNCSIPVGYHSYDEDENGNIINSKLYYGAAVPYSYVDKKAVTSISVVENQTYEFDWNAMYFMKSNTNNKDIEILDGNGNRVTDYKYSYCLLILPKESFERTEWTVSKGEDRKKDTIHGLVAGMSDKQALIDTAKIEMLQFDVDPTKKLKIKPQDTQIYKIAF